MNTINLSKKDLLEINGGNVPYQSSFDLGSQLGDYLAGVANGILTVMGLKKIK